MRIGGGVGGAVGGGGGGGGWGGGGGGWRVEDMPYPKFTMADTKKTLQPAPPTTTKKALRVDNRYISLQNLRPSFQTGSSH